MNDREQLKAEIIKEVLSILGSYDRVPFEVQKALTLRLKLNDVPTISTSSTAVATYTQAVNEAGSASYNVAKIMTGFRTLTDGDGNNYTIATYG